MVGPPLVIIDASALEVLFPQICSISGQLLPHLYVPTPEPPLLLPHLAVSASSPPLPHLALSAPSPPLPHLDVPAPAPPLPHIDVPAPSPPLPHLAVPAPSPPWPHLTVPAPRPLRPHLAAPAPSPPLPRLAITAPTPPRAPRVRPRAPRGHSTDNSTRPPSLVPCTRPGNEDLHLLLPAQLLQLLLKNGRAKEHGSFKQYNEAGFEMGELGSWANDDDLVKMEAGYLPHRCRDDSFEDSETSELLISKLSSLVEEIYRDLPENLQKKLGDELRRVTKQPANNSGQTKGFMWGTFISSVCVSLASHLAMSLLSLRWRNRKEPFSSLGG